MADRLSTRERVLEFIRKFIEERGYPPTIRDIARGCGIKVPSLVQYHLEVLEREGHIRRDPGVFRSIQLTEERTVRIPFLGLIAAGKSIPVPTPDTWTQVPEESLELPQEIIGRREKVYALKVKGLSMIDALVDDGDIVVLEATNTVEDGEMAAVWLRDREEVTLKKVYQEPGQVRLQPANREMEPILVRPENVEIQGRVIAVIRKVA